MLAIVLLFGASGSQGKNSCELQLPLFIQSDLKCGTIWIWLALKNILSASDWWFLWICIGLGLKLSSGNAVIMLIMVMLQVITAVLDRVVILAHLFMQLQHLHKYKHHFHLPFNDIFQKFKILWTQIIDKHSLLIGLIVHLICHSLKHCKIKTICLKIKSIHLVLKCLMVNSIGTLIIRLNIDRIWSVVSFL